MNNMDRVQMEQLAQDMHKVVRDYFHDKGWGRCEPCVSYSTWDIKKYTFRIVSMTRNTSANYCMSDDRMDVDSFRREIRSLLKRNGFTRCKFDTNKVTYTGGAFGDEHVVRLNAIYFDV